MILQGEAYGPVEEAALKQPAKLYSGQVLKVGKMRYYKVN
jgi:hypothetical protein